jgi:hypothetical protein
MSDGAALLAFLVIAVGLTIVGAIITWKESK